ncbi:MAG: RNA polymerase sigma factor [Steroidobacteraceae bacterium]
MRDTVSNQQPVHESADPTDEAQRAYLTLLFNKYRGALLRHVERFTRSPEDAADIVQDTYLRVMHRISIARFDAETRAYLFQTATNLARDHHRRQLFRSHSSLEEAPDDSLQASEPTPEQRLAAGQIGEALGRAIAAMPTGTRQVFLLARVQTCPTSRSPRLGVGRRTVNARRMAEAMTLLIACLRHAS